jgi:hypothetical protein
MRTRDDIWGAYMPELGDRLVLFSSGLSRRRGCNPAHFKARMCRHRNENPVGAWRSPVAYSLGVRVVGRSNRLAPTKIFE